MLLAGALTLAKNPKVVKTAMNLANDPKVKKAALTALSKGGGNLKDMNGLVQAAIGK